jgi:hypothetical protein
MAADFPAAIFTPRTTANLPGVVYDPSATTEVFAEDYNKPAAEIAAIEETLGVNPQGSSETVSERISTLNNLYVQAWGTPTTFDIDTNGGLQNVVLTDVCTLAFTVTLNRIFAIILTQPAGGSKTVTWPAGISWAGGSAPTLSAGANKSDCFVFIRTGSGAYIGLVAGQNI